MTEPDPLCACAGLSVVHGAGPARVEALSGADLAIYRGEFVALIGPSGSGKTTLLHALGGLVEPTSGEVHLAGRPLSSLDAAARGRARAGRVSYVFQASNLLPHLDVGENLALAHLVVGAAERELPDPFHALALVGLADRTRSLPADLSGGERQRVAIARAIVQRPDLLLCDEPTGQLDSDTGRRILDMLVAVREEVGFALVIATHDAEVASRADRVVRLDGGRIVPGAA